MHDLALQRKNRLLSRPCRASGYRQKNPVEGDGSLAETNPVNRVLRTCDRLGGINGIAVGQVAIPMKINNKLTRFPVIS